MSPAAYTFSSQLSFSSNDTLGCLIADIPLLAAGLLAFAVASLFLVTKKLNLAIVFISSSALFDFFAAILDLSQIILRGSVDGSSDSAINTLMSIRDIFFSLGSGARFLAFWTIVAQCPRGEVCRTGRDSPNPSQTFLSSSSSIHTGSWIRWGLAGLLLKWSTAAMAVAIALLQILWRTIDTFDNTGPVYAVDNGLEIVASVIFVIKMLLNSAIVETVTSWQMLLQYSPMILALGLNISIGVVNLAVFAFSESTLGRLLLAIELYIVIETLLVWNFHPPKPRESDDESTISEKRRASSFQGLRISRGDPLRPSSILGEPSSDAPRVSTLSRLSVSGRRMSSWMIQTTSGLSGRYRIAPDRDNARLYDPQDAERGRSPSPTGTEQGATTAYDRSPTEPKQSARYPDPVYTSFFMDSQREQDPYDAQKPSQPINDSAGKRVSEATSHASFYNGSIQNTKIVTAPPPAVLQPDSPIFGLNGTLRGGRFSPFSVSPVISSPKGDGPILVESPVSLEAPRPIGLSAEAVASARSSGYDQLMREQNELEKSIAQLRIFSSSSMDQYGLTQTTDSSLDSVPRRPSASYPPPSSIKSEFSLSNFPEPPLARRSSQVRPSSALLEEHASAFSDVQSGRSASEYGRESPVFELVPPRMPAVLASQTVPSSTRTSEDSAFLHAQSRTESAGTQYDVTSFIGTLSRPLSKGPSALAVSVKPDDEMSEPTSATSAEIVAVERRPSDGKAARAYRLEGGSLRKGSTDMVAPAVPDLVTAPSRSQSADDTVNVAPRNASPTSSLSHRVDFGRTASGKAVGLPARPRMIGLPQRRSSMDPLAFEQPRPAPGPTF